MYHLREQMAWQGSLRHPANARKVAGECGGGIPEWRRAEQGKGQAQEGQGLAETSSSEV